MKKAKNITKDCKVCQKSFKARIINRTGRAQIYCDRKCKEKYEKQTSFRSLKRNKMKLELIKLKGGECESCGYNKNYAALCFHHIDPREKVTGLNVGTFSERNRAKIFNEVKKCQLLCSNCHAEVHNEDSIL